MSSRLSRFSPYAVLSLSTGEQRDLVEGVFPRYAPTGHIVFGRANSLWAVPFDADRLELTGEPKPVLEGVQVTGDGMANFPLWRWIARRCLGG